MKYLCVSNKVGTPCALFIHKIQILAFGGLGELLNSSLATENPSFRQLKTRSRTTLTTERSLTLFYIKMFEYHILVA